MPLRFGTAVEYDLAKPPFPRLPAMLAPVHRLADGALMAVHRTFACGRTTPASGARRAWRSRSCPSVRCRVTSSHCLTEPACPGAPDWRNGTPNGGGAHGGRHRERTSSDLPGRALCRVPVPRQPAQGRGASAGFIQMSTAMPSPADAMISAAVARWPSNACWSTAARWWS